MAAVPFAATHPDRIGGIGVTIGARMGDMAGRFETLPPRPSCRWRLYRVVVT